jgi:endonuclease/exonuclease/phosphatase (EEP) superfamily protein YafD
MFRRLAAAALIVAVAAALLVAVWPQLLGLQTTIVVAQVVSLRGLVALAAAGLLLLVAVPTLASRRFRRLGAALCVLLLVFVGASAAVLATRGFGPARGEQPDSDKAAGPLTVLAWNTLGDAPGSAIIAELAIDEGADVLSLPETSEETAREVAAAMTDAGLPMSVLTVAFNRIATAKSTSLLVSDALGDYSIDEGRGTTSVVPSVVATPDDGSGPLLVAAHPVAPIPGYLDEWRRDLEWLAGVCDDPDVVMAGDLNSTIDHYGPPSRSAATLGGCADAALASGSAAVGTWPTWLPAVLGAPIDHVMATPNWRATSFRVVQDLDSAGSDHRPVIATLEPLG